MVVSDNHKYDMKGKERTQQCEKIIHSEATYSKTITFVVLAH